MMNVCKWQPSYSEEKQYTMLAVKSFDTDQSDGQNRRKEMTEYSAIPSHQLPLCM